MKDVTDTVPDRQAWMSLLAKAPEGRVMALLREQSLSPAFTWLRAPEIGTVMVRGRAGGTGAPFNLGEMTVTRCVLKLESGIMGHGYVQGRRKSCAEAAALVDALMQTEQSGVIASEILRPLEQDAQVAKNKRAAKAAATKVEFFTLVRGED